MKHSFEDLNEIVHALRAEDGCPWDKAQTHMSIRTCMIEEAAEAIDAISLLEEKGNPDALREELGDVLFQVVLHSTMAEEEGYFTLDDVVSDISEKMIRRHPHVFGVYETDGNGTELRDWDRIKQYECSKKTWKESKIRKKRRKWLTYLFVKLLSFGKAVKMPFFP